MIGQVQNETSSSMNKYNDNGISDNKVLSSLNNLLREGDKNVNNHHTFLNKTEVTLMKKKRVSVKTETKLSRVNIEGYHDDDDDDDMRMMNLSGNRSVDNFGNNDKDNNTPMKSSQYSSTMSHDVDDDDHGNNILGITTTSLIRTTTKSILDTYNSTNKSYFSDSNDNGNSSNKYRIGDTVS